MFAQEMERAYLDKAAALNLRLADLASRRGLGVALEMLHEHQSLSGVCDPTPPERYAIGSFLATVRLGRSLRHMGAGAPKPPAGFAAVNDGCFLDVRNILWKSFGQQIGLEVRLADRRYVALCQPFSIETLHYTIALGSHRAHAPTSTDADVRIVLAELIDLAMRLPGWIAFLNGNGAGASLRQHHHFQAFRRAFVDLRFPLESAAETAFATAPPPGSDEARTLALGPGRYPLTVLVAEGHRDDVLGQLVGWASAWRTFNHADEACGNWIAVGDQERADRVRVYFVPRSPFFAKAAGFVGQIASIETLGEIVITTEEWRTRLERGEITPQVVCAMLKAVEPPGAQAFVARHFTTTRPTSPGGRAASPKQ